MTKYQKYTWVCTGDCDALIEYTLKDGYGWPAGVMNLTCRCNSNCTLLSVEDATIPYTDTPLTKGNEMETTETVTPAVPDTYNANLLVTYKVIKGYSDAEYTTDKVASIEWDLHNGRKYNERVNELADPEQSINRARQNWQKLGRSEKWIAQRMTGQETRNKLTDYWKNADVKEGDEFAILTNIIHQEWTGLNISQHKKLKNLKSQNLRDHMNEAELIFTALAELSTRQIAETLRAKGFEENKIPAKKGGKIASDAKLALEQKTGKKIVDGSNFLSPKKLNKKLK